jgi:hypothetical protein
MSAPYWEPLGAIPGGALTPPTTPGDDGKWLRAQGGAAVWTAGEPKPWIAVSAFLSNWTNYGAGTSTCAYYKDAFGIVHVKGTVTGGTVGTSVFNFPVGFRPVENAYFATQSASAYALVAVIAANGDLIMSAGATGGVSLEAVQFRAA